MVIHIQSSGGHPMQIQMMCFSIFPTRSHLKPLGFNRLCLKAPCRGLVHGGVHASHLPHHLEEFPRSTAGWTASTSTQEVQDGGDSLFLNTQTSDRRSGVCLALQSAEILHVVSDGMTWLIWIHTHSYTACHAASHLLWWTAKNLASLSKFAKRNSALNSLCQKRYIQLTPSSISSRLSSMAMVAGFDYPPAFIRESSFASPKTSVFFSDQIFFELEDPQIWEVLYISWMSWKIWKSIQWSIIWKV